MDKFFFGYIVYSEGAQPVKWRERDGKKIPPNLKVECPIEITSVQYHGLSLETLSNLHPYSPPISLT